METKQVIIIGIGRFGTSVAEKLTKEGHEVLAVDIDEDVIERVKDKVTQAVTIDNLDARTMNSLGVGDLDIGVVAIGSDMQANIKAAQLLKQLGLMVVARSHNELHGNILSKIGADQIIYPERDMGGRVSDILTAVNVIDYIELSPEIPVAEVAVGPDQDDKKLKQLDMRTNYGVTVLAIRKSGEEIKISPSAEDSISRGDNLILVGPREGIHKVKNKFEE